MCYGPKVCELLIIKSMMYMLAHTHVKKFTPYTPHIPLKTQQRERERERVSKSLPVI